VREVPLAAAPARDHGAAASTPAPGTLTGGTGSAPALGTNFQGPEINDPGAGWIPPDPHGAIGPDHFVAIVNQHLSVYDRSGTRLLSTSLQSFFNVTGSVGDVRAAYDHFSGRFVITASGFSATGRIYLAVSSGGDPAAAWFKTFFVAASGSDVGTWADYPTLGFDANGIYSSAFMVGNGNTMTIFAIDKAPLVAPVQSLGTITAFRGLPYEDAIQGAVTFGSPGGEYMVSRADQTSLRLRRVLPPLSAPTLVELGFVSVPFNSTPPDMPVQGSIPLWTIDARPLGTVFQAGSLWTLHSIDVAGRAAVRWYEIDPLALVTLQVGTIDDPARSYSFPSLAVNANGDVAFGFAGSKSSEFASAWTAGRRATDAAGETSPPALLKAGVASYQLTDGGGNNRWGDYTNTTLDPRDGASFWTIQEYAQGTDEWGTWIGQLTFGGDDVVEFCFGDGIDPQVTTDCPCLNFGTAGHGCGNSVQTGGALLAASGTLAPDSLQLSASDMPPTTTTIYIQGDAVAPSGIVFGDGVRCAAGRLLRLGLKIDGDADGATSFGPASGDPQVSVAGAVVPGNSYFYQTFYRNPAPGWCPTATFNITNGVRVDWP
jgi:hypothetical protein